MRVIRCHNCLIQGGVKFSLLLRFCIRYIFILSNGYKIIQIAKSCQNINSKIDFSCSIVGCIFLSRVAVDNVFALSYVCYQPLVCKIAVKICVCILTCIIQSSIECAHVRGVYIYIKRPLFTGASVCDGKCIGRVGNRNRGNIIDRRYCKGISSVKCYIIIERECANSGAERKLQSL